MFFASHVKSGLPVIVEITYATAGERATFWAPGCDPEVEFVLHWRGGVALSDKVLATVPEADLIRIEGECFDALKKEQEEWERDVYDNCQASW